MKRAPGEPGFEEPPSFPARFGRWTAVTRQRYQGAEATRWVYDWNHYREQDGNWGPISLADDTAILSLTETGVSGGYCTTTRYFEIRYRDAEIEETMIARDVPRRSAFEIAEHTLESLDKPVGELSAKRRQLEAIDGVGPAKSRDLLLLGLSSPRELRDYLDTGSTVSHHHADRVEALLTNRIQDDIN